MTRHPPIETLIYLALSVAAVSAVVLGVQAPGAWVQTVALAAGVAIIGLPHGALDPLLARRAGLVPNWRAMAVFHAAYIGVAVLVVALWFVAPALSLGVFLVYSAHHFAGDWMSRPVAARTLMGAALLSLPAVFDAPAVAEIYAVLSGDAGRQIAAAQQWLAPVWLFTAGAGIISVVWRGRLWDALEIAMFSLSAMLLPPLVFFLIYFCALHSPRHLLQIWRESENPRQAAGIAALYTGAALMIAIPAALAFSAPGEMATSMQRVVFIGLAALTVPHMILSSILGARARV